MILRLLLVFTIIGFGLSKSYSQEKKEDNPFNVKWDNGFKVESKDKNFKLKFGGRVHIDHAYFLQDDDLDNAFGELESDNGTEFRRARLFTSGTIYKNVVFKLNMDFAGGSAKMKDAYIGVKNIPFVGNILVGHMKEPIRFEALTSSKYITFMERGILSDVPQERNNGILLFNEFLDNRLGIQTGFFRNADGFGNDKEAEGGHAFTSRLTYLPVKNDEKEQLLHLGVSYSYRKPGEDEYKISTRPKSHLGQKYLNTGTIEDVNSINIFNFETVFTQGPFTFQAEYLTSSIDQDSGNFSQTLNFNNFYGQVSYFITGEHRPYKNSYSAFDRLKPKNNFITGDNGIGAWEVALRYSYTDLDDKNVYGGEQADITFGTNWYLNPATRIMFNYVWTDIDKKYVGSGNLNIFEMRFQIDF
ncbi:MAG: porin [Bacteroidota bacterium]